MTSSKLLLISFFITSFVFAGVARIEQMALNIANVNPIHLSFGRVTVIEFPCKVKKVNLGLSESFKVVIDETTQKEIAVSMSGDREHPSNMIVRCDNYQLVFDLIPNKKDHISVLKITSFFENRIDTNKPSKTY